MKDLIKLIGIIALIAIIGFSVIACNNGMPSGTGNPQNTNDTTTDTGENQNDDNNNNQQKATVIVKNSNSIAILTYVFIEGNLGLIIKQTSPGEKINPNASKTFTDISPGTYKVGAIDEFAYEHYKQITLTAGQTLTVTYNGPSTGLN